MSMDESMAFTVDILGNADSVVSAAGQAGSAIKGFEGVSEGAVASLTAAITKLDLDFTKMGESAVSSATHVKQVGTAAEETKTLLEDMNRAGGAGARMFSTMGIEAGAAAERIEAFTGVLEEMKALAPELIAIGAAIAAVGAAFTFFKDGIADAERMQQSMDQLRAVVDEQGKSWGGASEQIQKFIENESLVSGIAQDELASAFANLAGKIHDVSDAETILRIAEEEHIATGKSLEEVTNALLEAEAGRGMTLAQLDPRLKTLIQHHADLDTILKVLHEDNIKAIDDQHNAAIAWDRARVVLAATGEEIGDHMLPMLQYLGEAFIGGIQVAEDFAKAIGIGIHGSAGLFIDSVGAMISAASALSSAMHGDIGGALTDLGDAKKHFFALGGDMRDATVGWMPSVGKGLYDLFHMHQIGHADVNEAIYQHDRDASHISLDYDPTVGLTKGGHGKGGHGSKAHKSGGSVSGLHDLPDVFKGQKQAVDATDEAVKKLSHDLAGLKAAQNDLAYTVKQETKEHHDLNDALYAQEVKLHSAVEAYNAYVDKVKKSGVETAADKEELKKLKEAVDAAQHSYDGLKSKLDAVNASLKHHQAELDATTAKVKAAQDAQEKAVEEGLKKQQEAWQKEHDKEIALIQKWSDTGVKLLNDFFDRGHNGFKKFSDDFKKMLDDMLVALERSALAGLLERILGVSSTSNGSLFGGGASTLGGAPGMSLAAPGGGGSWLANALGIGSLFAGGAPAPGSLAAFNAASDQAAQQAFASYGGGAAPGASSGGASGFAGLLGGKIPWAKDLGGASVGSYLAAAAGGALVGQTVFGGKGFADVGGALGATAALALAGPAGWAAIAAMTLGGALIGGGAGSLFGNHFNPANEPDITQTDLWGQSNADMNGNTSASPMNANGKQFVMDSWTQQATNGKGWNLTFEKFVQLFRGKESSLPKSLQSAFPRIQQLWGGATDQPNFNHDGKDGWLDIGSGARAKWTEFWQYVQQFGPQIAQMVDQYQSNDVYTSSNGSASLSGTYTPSGSPSMLHGLPDYGAYVPSAPVSSPSPGGSNPNPGSGPSPNPDPGSGPIHPRGPQPMIVHQEINVRGSVVTTHQLYAEASTAAGRASRVSTIRSINRVGK